MVFFSELVNFILFFAKCKLFCMYMETFNNYFVAFFFQPHSDSSMPLRELAPHEAEKFVMSTSDSPQVQIKSSIHKTKL